MRSTIFDRKLKERKAAAEILITPPMVVASKMEDRVVSIFSPIEFNKRRDYTITHSMPAIRRMTQMPALPWKGSTLS
jgi:hypothetical protein